MMLTESTKRWLKDLGYTDVSDEQMNACESVVKKFRRGYLREDECETAIKHICGRR